MVAGQISNCWFFVYFRSKDFLETKVGEGIYVTIFYKHSSLSFWRILYDTTRVQSGINLLKILDFLFAERLGFNSSDHPEEAKGFSHDDCQ